MRILPVIIPTLQCFHFPSTFPGVFRVRVGEVPARERGRRPGRALLLADQHHHQVQPGQGARDTLPPRQGGEAVQGEARKTSTGKMVQTLSTARAALQKFSYYLTKLTKLYYLATSVNDLPKFPGCGPILETCFVSCPKNKTNFFHSKTANAHINKAL